MSRDIVSAEPILASVSFSRGSVKLEKAIVVFLHVLVTLAVSCFSYLLADTAGTSVEEQSRYTLSLLLFMLLCWSLLSWWLVRGTLFDPYALFIVAAFLFNGGHSLLEVLGMLDAVGGYLRGQFSTASIVLALAYIVPALAATHLGGLCAAQRVVGEPRRGKRHGRRTLDEQATRLVGLALIAVALLPFLLVWFENMGTLLEGGRRAYGAAESSRLSSALSILALFLLPGVLFALAGSRGAPWTRLLATVLVLVFALFHLAAGQRLVALMPLIMFIWVWDRVIKRINRALLLVGGGVMAFVLIPLIREVRHAGKIAFAPDLESLTLGLQNVFREPLVRLLGETGLSMRPMIWTQQWVPAIRDFEWGATYLKALSAVVPNLFFQVHPAMDGGSPKDWLKELMAHRGHGFGYSYIAEAYLNFWVYGIVFLIGIGWLFSRLCILSDHSTRWVAAVAVLFSMTLVFVRGQALDVTRPLFWYALIPILGVTLLISTTRSHGLSRGQV